MSDLNDDALAAEYVLGVLEVAQTADAERRLATDQTFANAVDHWRRTFAELDDTADPVTPPHAMWDHIASRLTTPAPKAVKGAAAQRATNSIPSLISAWRDSLSFWRGAALATSLAGLVLIAGFAASLMRAPQTPIYVAILLTENSNEPAALVNTFADGRAELVPLRDIAAPDGRTLQVWTLWDRAVGPRSIGLAQAIRTMNLNLNNLPATGQGQLFEITLEPKGGSPTGRPTGPILMKGLTTRTL